MCLEENNVWNSGKEVKDKVARHIVQGNLSEGFGLSCPLEEAEDYIECKYNIYDHLHILQELIWNHGSIECAFSKAMDNVLIIV